MTDFDTLLGQCRGPLTFTGPMSLAVREGRKSQTMRIIKDLPSHWIPSIRPQNWGPRDFGFFDMADPNSTIGTCFTARFAPGDLAYVAEGIERRVKQVQYVEGAGDDASLSYDWDEFAYYRADGKPVLAGGSRAEWQWKPRSLPSRYMRKAFARTIIRVGGVDVVRVGDITPEQIRAEGLRIILRGEPMASDDLQRQWIDLWNFIHPKPPHDFASSPWCFRYYDLEVVATKGGE